MTIPAGVSLTIQEGTVVRVLAYVSLNETKGRIIVNGTLNINGTSNSPVTITSIRDPQFADNDDYYSLDLFDDLFESHWVGVIIGSSGAANIDFTRIKFAGLLGSPALSDQGSLSLTNSEIKNALSEGIRVDSTINPIIHNNSFIDCGSYAIRNINPEEMTVDASYNYWGSNRGPSRYVFDETTGLWYWTARGLRISTGVAYTPYYGYDLNIQYHFGRNNAPSGSFCQQVTDLSVANALQTLAATRTYNSLDARDDTSFGRGWSFGFEGSIKDYTLNLTDENGQLVTQTCPNIKIARLMNGSVCTFAQNADGTFTANDSHNMLAMVDGRYVLTSADQTVYTFNEAGRLDTITDKNGNTTTINLDLSGKITSIVDCTGRTFDISYVGNYISSITDATTNRTVNYLFTDGRLTQVIDPVGASTYYTYNAQGLLSAVHDNNQHTLSSVTYYFSGENEQKISTRTDALGNTWSYFYDLTNQVVTITDAEGRHTHQYFDENLNVIEEVDELDRSSYVECLPDDKYNEPVSTTDRNSNKTQFERDDRGNITQMTNPDSSTRVMTYDAKNNLLSQQDENGKLTFFVYDSLGNLIKKAQPLNGTDIYTDTDTGFSITTFTYYLATDNAALNGLLKTQTDPEGGVTTITYDAYGNLASKTDASNNTAYFTYNAAGWLLSQTSPSGYVTQYIYDNCGRQIKMALDDGATTRTVYDALGRMLQAVLPSQYSASDDVNGIYTSTLGTRCTYYDNGKLQSVTDAENNSTSYTYDQYGNTLTETNPNGATYRYTYDALDRLLNTYIRESSGSTEFLLQGISYSILPDKTTQQTVRTYNDTSSYTTEITTYDYAGREISKQNADGTTVTTTYNLNGTVASTKDPAGNFAYFTYDGLNRLVVKYAPFADDLYTYTGYTYDDAGRVLLERIGVAPVALNAIPTDFVESSYQYYANGLVLEKSDADGRRTVYYYDADSNISKTEVYSSATEKITTEYEYNHVGKVIQKTQHISSGDLVGNDFTGTTDTSLVTENTYDANGNLETVTTPDGVTTVYTFDNLNRQLSQSTPGVDEFGAATSITAAKTYTWDGQVSTATDAEGNVTTFEYDKRGRLIKTIDAAGGVTRNDYDLAGHLIAVVSPRDFNATAELCAMNRTEYTYDAMGRVITVSQVCFDSNTSQWVSFVEKAYQYDANGNKTKELGAAGYAAGTGSSVSAKIASGFGTEYTYNAADLLISELDAVTRELELTSTRLFDYDALGRKVAETNAHGVTTRYTCNDRGDVLAVTVQENGSATEQTLASATYDFLGHVLTQTDGNGNTTAYTYNAFGQVRTVAYPGDSTIVAKAQSYQYDTVGRLVKTWDSAGSQQTITYDNQGRMLSQTTGKTDGTELITQSNAYDKNGNVRFNSDGNGNSTETTFDALNRPLTQALTGKTTTLTYDANGNQLTTTDWRGNTVTYEYDQLNRLTETTDATGSVIESLAYDNDSRQTSSVDALGHTTSFEYDHNGRLTVTTDAEGSTTTTAYDNVGNVDYKTDANDQLTYYAYDAFNRLTTLTNAKDETTSYTYDLNGNMLTQTDGAGNTTAYEYNVANLLTRLIAPGGRTGTPGNYTYDLTKLERYTYTAAGLLADKIDENGHTTAYTYDSHGRKLSETCGTLVINYTYDYNGNVLTMTDSTGTTTRTYDVFNRVLSKTVPDLGTSEFVYDITANMATGCRAETGEDPSGNITQKIYDRNGRLWQVTADGDTTTYSYYDNGSVLSVVYPDGASETYTYFDDNSLETLINRKADNTVIDSYSYTYDAAKNILSKTDGTGTTTYTYDELNRLLSETTNARARSFTYDAAGNRATETLAEGSDTTVTTYTCNAQNRLTGTSTTLNGSTAETVGYAYDNSGNLLTKTQTIYDSGIPQTPVVLQTNTYDALSQLITCVTSDGDSISNTYNGEGLRVVKTVNGTVTQFLYEASKVVAEYDATGTLKAWNIYGLNLLVRISTSASYYYLYNGHADVTALLNATTGVIDGTYYYDAFGNILSQTGTADNSILYSGYQYDQETGLYYLNARMYDPVIARFLQEDTYRGDPNDPLSLNLYAYCANNPLIYSDPTGHRPMTLYTDSGKNKWGNLYTNVQQTKGNSKSTSGVAAYTDGGSGDGPDKVSGIADDVSIVFDSDSTNNWTSSTNEMIIPEPGIFESKEWMFFQNRADAVLQGGTDSFLAMMESISMLDSAAAYAYETDVARIEMYRQIVITLMNPDEYNRDFDVAYANDLDHQITWAEGFLGTLEQIQLATSDQGMSNFLLNPDMTEEELEEYVEASITTVTIAAGICSLYDVIKLKTAGAGSPANAESSSGGLAGEGAGKAGADNIATGSKLNAQLTYEEASSVFTKSGTLKPEIIKNSDAIIPGSKLNNPDVIKALISDGSSINDWAKMSTQTFKSPSGDFQVHFYQNIKTGQVSTYEIKVKFN